MKRLFAVIAAAAGYKHLLCPRGVAFLALPASFESQGLASSGLYC